jgi:hypothetical protein
VENRKEPETELEPQFVILTKASAHGGNLISAPRLWLRNNACHVSKNMLKTVPKIDSKSIGNFLA